MLVPRLMLPDHFRDSHLCWAGRTDTRISEKHWMRKPYDQGGLPRLKVRGINQRRGMGQRPMSLPKANAILDGFWVELSWMGVRKDMWHPENSNQNWWWT